VEGDGEREISVLCKLRFSAKNEGPAALQVSLQCGAGGGRLGRVLCRGRTTGVSRQSRGGNGDNASRSTRDWQHLYSDCVVGAEEWAAAAGGGGGGGRRGGRRRRRFEA
jgi:hypothetical protein